MSHEPNAPDATATVAPEAPVGAGEPVPDFVARAARILRGDIRPEDYLPEPTELIDALGERVRHLSENGFEATPTAKRFLLNDWALQHHHGGQMVLAKRTERGVIVLAVGPVQVGAVQQKLNIDYRSGFAHEVPMRG